MWATAHNPTNVLIAANVKLFSCFLLQFRGNKLLNDTKDLSKILRCAQNDIVTLILCRGLNMKFTQI